MSFSTDAKLEVLDSQIDNDCCSIAFLSAIIKCSGELSISAGHKISVSIYTELPTLYDKIKSVIEQYYGIECEISLLEDTNISKSAVNNYELGLQIPSAQVIVVLAKYFNVSSDYLLGLKDY